MSRLFRFLSAPCASSPELCVADAIADWLISSERMRHMYETPKADQQPGHCCLCGAETEAAFYISSGDHSEARLIGKRHAEFDRVRAAWVEGGVAKDKAGVEWVIRPSFFCSKASQGPTQKKPKTADLFSMAEVIVRRRQRDAAAREAQAAKTEAAPTHAPRRIKGGL